MQYKLGKLPARKDSIKLKFKSYSNLPTAPASAGHASLITDWGMLGNDQYGDCVWAGAGHETMLWNAEACKEVSITTEGVLEGYSAVTGFNPNDPSTDQGTDMQLAAKYRQDVGIKDANGNLHKVGAYLAVESAKDIKEAIYLFGAIGIGVNLPESAQDQFESGEWTVVPNSEIEGGHYIPGVTYDEQYVYIVTWGKTIKATWAWIEKYMDEGIVYLSEEFLNGDKSPEGFDLATLKTDLAAIK